MNKYRFTIPGHDQKSMGRKSVNPTRCSVSVAGKPNRSVIFPANATTIAESIERRNKNWIIRAKIPSDLIVQVGDSSFHLHKLPMVSRSGYLNRLVFERRGNGEKGNNSSSKTIHIDNFPGGCETFELVVKFCYGWKVDITASNIATLYCAANFLEMSDDLEQGNLISKTEAFLTFVMFSSWKDTFQILKSCESVPSWAKELQILKRCSESIAWKVCTDLKAFGFDDVYGNGTEEDSEHEGVVDDTWWFEDVSSLRIDHFIEVVESVKQKGMRSEVVGLCIAKWTGKWLSQITSGLNNMTSKHLTHQLRRVTTESLIRLLPSEENSVSCNFLLHLLKLGLLMKINIELSSKLERRIASMLEQCCVPELLVKNYSENDTAYDIGIVIRVVASYVSFVLKDPAPRIFVVGRLVDGYLTLVARDKNLAATSFQSLAEALPKCARHCDDNLYRAMDIYLKAHPSLTEDERTSVCRAMEYHKLSQEARQHMMKNDRLPLKIRTQFILLEQVNMTRSMTALGSNYRRTKAQAIIRVSKGLQKGWMTSQKEIKNMKKEVDTMKMQLHELHRCKIEIQKQVKRWH